MRKPGETIGRVILWTLGVLPYLAWALRLLLDRVIAAPGMVDDAETWQSDWLPAVRNFLLAVQTEPAAWVASTLALLLALWLVLPEIKRRLFPKARVLAIEFPGIASAEDRQGDHYRVTSVLPSADGKPVDVVPIVREVRFAVRNGSQRTVDDVTVKVRTVGFGQEPDGKAEMPRRLRPRVRRTPRLIMEVIDFRLPNESGESAKVSIAPDVEEKFTLSTVIDKDSGPVPGMFMMDCPRVIISRMIAMHDGQKYM